MNLEKLKQSAPKLPAYRAHWRSVRMEPIVNSGESITIAVIAHGEDNDIAIHEVCSIEQLKCIYNERWTAFNSVIKSIVAELKEQALDFGNIENIHSSFESVDLGIVRLTAAKDMQDVINQAIEDSSAFGSLVLHEMIEDEEMKLDSWRKNVNKILEAKAIHKGRTQAELTLTGDHFPTAFDYYSQKITAQYSYISPKATGAQLLRNVKPRIFDLENLMEDEINQPDKTELIVGIDESTRNTENGENLLDQLYHYTAIRNIGFHVSNSPGNAANHIDKSVN